MSFAKDDRVSSSRTLPAGDGTVVAVHDVDGGTAYDVLVDGVGLCRFGEGDLAAAGSPSTDSKPPAPTFTPPAAVTPTAPASSNTPVH